jgi:hypothetical protein
VDGEDIRSSGLEIGRVQLCRRNCVRGKRDDEDIRSTGLVQINDGIYAEVPLWCARGPIARRWIVPTCVWKLSDCKNCSE